MKQKDVSDLMLNQIKKDEKCLCVASLINRLNEKEEDSLSSYERALSLQKTALSKFSHGLFSLDFFFLLIFVRHSLSLSLCSLTKLYTHSLSLFSQVVRSKRTNLIGRATILDSNALYSMYVPVYVFFILDLSRPYCVNFTSITNTLLPLINCTAMTIF